MVSIAVVGAGAIGGTLAAWLGQVAGNDVRLCLRPGAAVRFEQLIVEVPGGRTIASSLPVSDDPSRAAPVEWIVVATKAYDNDSACRWIESSSGPQTCVAVAQNGVEHMERFAGVVPAARTLPVIVDLSAERSAPGRIRQRHLGRLAVPAGELGERFGALFATTPITIARVSEFTTEAWRKLVLNSAGVVQALTGKPAGVVRHDKAAALMRGIALETFRVGRAVGARLEDGLVDAIMDRFRASSPDAKNSLLADRLAGRRLEIDARNGVVVRLGKQHGVPTPLNEMAIAILEAASAG